MNRQRGVRLAPIDASDSRTISADARLMLQILQSIASDLARDTGLANLQAVQAL